LVYLSNLLFPNSYIILFWEFYFLPFSVHAQTSSVITCEIIVHLLVIAQNNNNNEQNKILFHVMHVTGV
jgi:hypothetical protein